MPGVPPCGGGGIIPGAPPAGGGGIMPGRNFVVSMPSVSLLPSASTLVTMPASATFMAASVVHSPDAYTPQPRLLPSMRVSLIVSIYPLPSASMGVEITAAPFSIVRGSLYDSKSLPSSSHRFIYLSRVSSIPLHATAGWVVCSPRGTLGERPIMPPMVTMVPPVTL